MKPPGVIGQILTARPPAEQDRLIRARYVYLGDKLTDLTLRGQFCDPIRRTDGKVLRGRNRNAAVRFADGREVVVLGRHLRLTSPAIPMPARRPCEATEPAQTKGGDPHATAPGKPGDSDGRAATVPSGMSTKDATHTQAARLIAPSTDAAP
jgi:hypothetical protein